MYLIELIRLNKPKRAQCVSAVPSPAHSSPKWSTVLFCLAFTSLETDAGLEIIFSQSFTRIGTSEIGAGRAGADFLHCPMQKREKILVFLNKILVFVG